MSVMTVAINGYVYQVTETQNPFVTALASLKSLLESERSLGSAGQAAVLAEEEGEQYKNLYIALTDATLTQLTAAQQTAINTVVTVDLQTIHDEMNPGPPVTASLAAAITAIRSDSTLPEKITDALDALLEDAKIERRPPLQELVIFEFSQAGVEQMARELGELGDELSVVQEMLSALNNMMKGASTNEPQVTYKGELGSVNTTNFVAYRYRSAIARGYLELKRIQSEHTFNSELTGVLEKIINNASQLASAVNNGQNSSTILSRLKTWWANVDTSIDISNAQQQVEFLNESLKSSLRESLFTYQEFYDASTGLIARLNKVLRSIGHRVDSPFS